MTSESEIEVGDAVWIGEGKVHWEVVEIEKPTGRIVLNGRLVDLVFAKLRSGQTGRRTTAYLHELRLHSKGTAVGS